MLVRIMLSIHPSICPSIISSTSPTSSTMKAVHRGSASKAARSPRLSGEATEYACSSECRSDGMNGRHVPRLRHKARAEAMD